MTPFDAAWLILKNNPIRPEEQIVPTAHNRQAMLNVTRNQLHDVTPEAVDPEDTLRQLIEAYYFQQGKQPLMQRQQRPVVPQNYNQAGPGYYGPPSNVAPGYDDEGHFIF